MARGFESKDVEYQQAERERAPSNVRALSPAQRAAAERRQNLELALTNAREQRAAATHPNHRTVLDNAIQALEQELRSLT